MPAEKKKIFIAEDEPEIQDFVRKYLIRENFDVVTFNRGDTALETILKNPPDLIILDIMLPGKDGIEVLKKIRQNLYVPVILLTSKTDEADRIVGLELGADDYVTKPFSPRELVARVKSLFRRIEAIKTQPEREEIINSRNMTLNLKRRSLTINDIVIELTSIEFSILKLLMGKPGRIFTRDEMLSYIWGDDFTGETRTVDVHIKNLRKKIKQAQGTEDAIRAIWGVGYTFED
jgi:DNA-binding response OmpR family regulator